MATKETPEDTQFRTMFKTFQEMGLNPKGDTPEELDSWIKAYVAHTKEMKPVVDSGAILKTTKKDQSATNVVMANPPKVRSFSGGDNKMETPYDIWRYEVRLLEKDSAYTDAQKDFAVRRALTGSAARMVMYQGDLTVGEIIKTLDSVYGTIDSKEQLLAEFYSARQKDDEDVTSWSNRLQEIVSRGLEKKVVKTSEVNSMLHNMLYMGLRQELKDVSGHKFDAIQDFNQLRVVLRQIEKEHMPKKISKVHTAKAATNVEFDENYEELKGMVQQLSHTVTEMKNQQSKYSGQQTQSKTRGNFYRGRGGNRGYSQQRQQNWQQPSGQPQFRWNVQPSPMGQTQFRWNAQPPQMEGQQQQYNQEYQVPLQPQEYQPSQQNNQEPVCRRCGQRGHIQIGCRVILDHSQQALNTRRPVQRGRY